MRNHWCPSVAEGMRPSVPSPASGWRPPALCRRPLLLTYLLGLPLALRTVAVLFQVAQEAQQWQDSSSSTAGPAPGPPLSAGCPFCWVLPLQGTWLSVPMNCLRCQSLLGQTDRRPDSCSLVQLPVLRHHLFSVFSLPFLPSQLPAGQGPSISV